MRGHRLIGWVIGVPLVIVVLLLIILHHEPEREGISRAAAAKSLVLALLSPEELAAWEQEQKASHFPADMLGEWYVPYLDYLYGQGFLSEETTPADRAHGEGILTFGEAEQMMAPLGGGLAGLVKANDQNRDRYFPEERWWLLYDSVLKQADPEGAVGTEELVIYGTPDNVQGTPAWTAHTNLGRLTFYGLALDPYVDHQVTAYVRDREIIHVIQDGGSKTVYRNVWILDGSETELLVYVGEIERKIPFGKKAKEPEGLIHSMADLHMEDGKITKVSLKQDTISGKVLSVQEDAVELEGYGRVPLDEEYKVLKTYGTVEKKELADILVGYSLAEFVTAGGKICGVLIERPLEADTIRVLLMTDGFSGLYHQQLTFQSEGAVRVSWGDRQETVDAGTGFAVEPGDRRLEEGRLILEPAEGGEIGVTSLSRSQGIPYYGGRLEIVEAEEGLVLINELYLEDYLKKVVPSEMPGSYEKEALKAQAVCARTYAYMQLQSNTYSQYGAHVDDSTNFQVYNNTETSRRADEAVQETYGKLLLYEGEPVSAYYFSTSCGVTADGTLWGMEPGEAPYLKSVGLQPGRPSLELTSEEDFAAFIKRSDYPSYDSSYPYYRWQVTTNASVLTANTDGVGQVTDVKVTSRGPGGVARTLLITGTEGEKTVTGQNAIRAALGDESLEIHRKDGKTVTGWSSLPSGFLTVEDGGTDSQGVKQFAIYGGGYGHGVGMSQNGAQAMAQSGMSCEEILQFFYDGVTVEEMD